MNTPTQNDPGALRANIAAAAARMIVQDGADYATAKRKAARQLTGSAHPPSNVLPDNAQIEEEVLRYHALFDAERAHQRLHALRTTALHLLELLAPFNPFLSGAVLSGSAGRHDDIALQLFTDNAKEVELFLLDRRIAIEVSEPPRTRGVRHGPIETISFLWENHGVHAAVHEADAVRNAPRHRADGKILRADASAVRALLAAQLAAQMSNKPDQDDKRNLI